MRSRDTGSSRRTSALLFLALLLILALASALRFYALGAQSLWSDEGNSAALAGRGVVQIGRDAANDIHPPLYYWLLHFWTQAFGTTEVALRSLSALAGVMLVVTLADLGRRLFNYAAGLAAAFLAAIAPFQVYYSQEARMYIVLALEATMAALLFWRFVAQEDRRLPAAGLPPQAPWRWLPFTGQMLVLVWTAGLYTHYAFPLIIALLSFLYVGWVIATWRRGQVGRRLVRWGLLLALAMGFYAPWAPVAFRQLTTWPGMDAAANLGAEIALLVSTLGLGPVAPEWVGRWWVWMLAALALLGALPWPVSNRQGQAGGRGMDWLRWVTPAAWATAPIAMIVVLGLFRDAYLKFLLVGSPAFALLLARGVAWPVQWALARRQAGPAGAPAAERTRPGWPIAAGVIWVIIALAAAAIPTGAATYRYFTDPALARDNYRGIVQFILATAHPQDAVLLTAPGQSEVFGYYYEEDLPVYALPRQRPLDPQATLAELEQLLQYDKVYAVFWAAEEADPGGLIRGWMNSRGYRTLDRWQGNVRFSVYVMPEHRLPDEIVDDLQVHLGESIMLEGYRGWQLTPSAGEVTQIQLVWRTEQPLTRRYKVFLQLLDPRDQVIAQRDAEPAGESRPTPSWQPSESVLDNHGLLIPPGTPPGSYRRIVGLYDAETLERLKLADGTDFVSLPPITVARSKTAPSQAALDMQYTQRFDFGAISLLGHDRYKRGFGHAPDTPLRPGDLLHVSFYWLANTDPRAEWWFDLSLNDASGKSVAALQAPLVGPTYHTTLWQEGEIVRGEHDLTLPVDLPPDTYRLSLVLLPDSETQAGIAYLGTVKVLEEAP